MNIIDKKFTYAVVGASNNTEKYGYKVLADLKNAGFNVIPINPKEKEILGLKVYKKISDIPKKIDVAIFIVPPDVTKSILPEILNLDINKIWLQPGSESDEIIKFCQDHNIECVHDACIMIEKNK